MAAEMRPAAPSVSPDLPIVTPTFPRSVFGVSRAQVNAYWAERTRDLRQALDRHDRLVQEREAEIARAQEWLDRLSQQAEHQEQVNASLGRDLRGAQAMMRWVEQGAQQDVDRLRADHLQRLDDLRRRLAALKVEVERTQRMMLHTLEEVASLIRSSSAGGSAAPAADGRRFVHVLDRGATEAPAWAAIWRGQRGGRMAVPAGAVRVVDGAGSEQGRVAALVLGGFPPRVLGYEVDGWEGPDGPMAVPAADVAAVAGGHLELAPNYRRVPVAQLATAAADGPVAEGGETVAAAAPPPEASPQDAAPPPTDGQPEASDAAATVVPLYRPAADTWAIPDPTETEGQAAAVAAVAEDPLWPMPAIEPAVEAWDASGLRAADEAGPIGDALSRPSASEAVPAFAGAGVEVAAEPAPPWRDLDAAPAVAGPEVAASEPPRPERDVAPAVADPDAAASEPPAAAERLSLWPEAEPPADLALAGEPVVVVVGPTTSLPPIEPVVDALEQAPGLSIEFRLFRDGVYRVDGRVSSRGQLARWLEGQPGVESVFVDGETLHVFVPGQSH
jgi:hypothetical protein